VSGQAAQDQDTILTYLHRRLAGGDQRYCTIPTIRKNTGIDASNQYILALTDDLETSGYIITRQAYQMSGGRLFQITAAGIDLVDSGKKPDRAESAAWTGKFELSAHQIIQVKKILVQIRDTITAAKLPNARTANALALVEAAERLMDTPDPLWPEIMRLLRSPVLGNIAGVASLVFAFVQIIIAAASS
jgi:hypothetical protein